MKLAAILVLAALIGFGRFMLVDGSLAVLFREYLRRWPGAKSAFVGNRRWIAFSKRFGLPYAIACVAAAFAWIFIGQVFLPNTTTGAWLLFGPMLLLIAVAAMLGGLRAIRWIADE
jgi:hypothetical protein